MYNHRFYHYIYIYNHYKTTISNQPHSFYHGLNLEKLSRSRSNFTVARTWRGYKDRQYVTALRIDKVPLLSAATVGLAK
jgi:hypothetical protein